MKCFYHHDRDSLGSCKSCGKGVCLECAVDLTKGLACRGHCEEDVRALIGLIECNIRLAPKSERIVETSGKVRESARQIRWGTAIFNLVIGGIFIPWGLTESDKPSFLTVLGVCFLGYGVFEVFQLRRSPKGRQNP